MEGVRPLGDAAGAARWARFFLCAQAALAALSAVIALSGGYDAYALTNGELLFDGLQGLVYLATGVLVLRWLYLANGNARALGADDMMVTPVMAVIWPFVPLANLVMPYLAVRELWRASSRPRDWQAAPGSPLLPLWWTVWIACLVTGAAGATLDAADDKSVVETAAMILVANDALIVTGSLLFAWILGRIEEMQADPAHLHGRFS